MIPLRPGWLPAELVARCVIAACVSVGLDPVAVMTAERGAKIRGALTAAASGLAATNFVSLARAARALGVYAASVSAARGKAQPGFTLAESEAKAAAIYWLNARGWRGGVSKGLMPPSPPPYVRTADPIRTPTTRPSVGMTTRMTGPLPDAPSVPALSTRRASLTVGKPAPPKAAPAPLPGQPSLGRHPSEVSGQSWEARRVRELREKNTPWPHVAQQIGKSEASLRAAYDPTYRGMGNG